MAEQNDNELITRPVVFRRKDWERSKAVAKKQPYEPSRRTFLTTIIRERLDHEEDRLKDG